MKAIVEDYTGTTPAGATSGEIVDGVHFYAGVRCPLPGGSDKEFHARRAYKWAVETAIFASLFKTRRARRAYIVEMARKGVSIRDYNRVRGFAVRQHRAYVAALRAAGASCNNCDVLRKLYA